MTENETTVSTNVRQAPKRVVWLVTGQVTASIFYFVFTWYVIRCVGLSSYGIVMLAMALGQLLFMFSSQWLDTGTIKFSVEAVSEKGTPRDYFWARIWIAGAILSVFGPLLYIFRVEAYKYMTHTSSDFLLLVVVFTISTWLFGTVNVNLQARGNMKGMALMYLGDRGLTLLTLIIFSLLLSSVNLITIFASICIGRGLIALLQLFTPARHDILPPAGFDIKVGTALLKYSWPLMIFTLFPFCTRWLDIIIVRWFMDVRSVGIYTAVFQFFLAGAIITTALINVIYPLQIEIIKEKRHDMMKRFLKLGAGHVTVFWSALLCIVMLISPLLLKVLNPQLAPYYPLLNIMLANLAISASRTFYGSLLPSLGKTKAYMCVGVAMILLQFAANLILVPIFGINGTAWASYITTIGGLFLYAQTSGKYFESISVTPLLIPIMFIPLIPTGLSFIGYKMSVAGVIIALIIYILIIRMSDLFGKESNELYEKIHIPDTARKIIMGIIHTIRGGSN